MNERALLGGDGSPLLTLAHIKKEADGSGGAGSGAGYMPCGLDFAVPSSPGSPDRQYCSSTTQFAGDVGCTADDVKEEEGTPRRACLVCGDVASGFHYGVASCEACKAFFKRTIQGNIEYTCPAANDCEINKRRRKACQACRFQKCLRMGMLKEGVRLDRVRGGRQKYRRSTDGPYQLQSPLPQLKPFPSLEDNKLLEALSVNEPDLSVTTPDINCSDPALRTLNTLSDIYDQELVKIITWAKHIPGFLELSLNDQMRLLQSTWAEVLTLTVAFRSIPSSSGELKFAADMIIDEKMARDCGLTEIYQIMLAIVERIKKLAVTKEEYYILKALILANSDVRIEEPQPLKRLREAILTALSDCVTAVRAGGSSLQLHHLLLCLPAVRQADHLHRRFWTTVHREAKVYMNKLFVEMLESYVRSIMDLMEFEELLLHNDEEHETPHRERKESGKRGRKPGRKAGEKVDVRAKLERSRQSARECRARKKLRYQYLEELVTDREKASVLLRKELEKYREWVRELDENRVPEGLAELLEELGAVKSESSN